MNCFAFSKVATCRISGLNCGRPWASKIAATARALDLLLKELPLKTAVRLCADITGTPRNVLYQAALARRQQADDDSA